MAVELIKGFLDFGVAVPDEIAVVGFDDFQGENSPVPLTTVRVPLWEEGQMTASLVVDILRGKSVDPGVVRMPVQIVVRESCGIKHLARSAIRTEALAQ
jgi:DNA-binding LacI/PurR family transcriptional regulator